MVRTWDGRPPPVKPYLVTQPDTASTTTRRLELPDRRIERRSGIGLLDDEGERTARALVTILDALTRAALHPLLNAATIYALEPGQ